MRPVCTGSRQLDTEALHKPTAVIRELGAPAWLASVHHAAIRSTLQLAAGANGQRVDAALRLAVGNQLRGPAEPVTIAAVAWTEPQPTLKPAA